MATVFDPDSLDADSSVLGSVGGVSGKVPASVKSSPTGSEFGLGSFVDDLFKAGTAIVPAFLQAQTAQAQAKAGPTPQQLGAAGYSLLGSYALPTGLILAAIVGVVVLVVVIRK